MAAITFVRRFVLPIPYSLQFVAQELEDHVANKGAYEGDEEVCRREDVLEREGEGFALAIDAGELAHEQVGIKKEDDKGDFDDDSPQGLEARWWRE